MIVVSNTQKAKYVIFVLFGFVIGFFNPIRSTEFEFDIIVNEEGASTKNLFFHTMNNTFMAILDSTLNPYWIVKVGEYGLDFKVNQNKLTYFYKDSSEWIITNPSMVEIDTIKCAHDLMTDYHDFLLVEGGGFILQAYHDVIIDMSQIIPNGYSNAIVNELVIQEFNENHDLIFEWYAHEHLDISNYSNLNLFMPEFTWMHGNSIEIDFDNNLIISNRRSSEAIKIDRISGNVIWILGGPASDFSFIHDTFNGFSQQHDIRRLENGNLLVFDNGVGHTPQISRIVEYELNLNTMVADLVWSFSHPEEYVGLSMGSVQRLENENTLINWGNIANSGAIITEVNMDKDILMEIQFPQGFNIYKVRKFDWQFNIDLTIGDLNLDNDINVMDILIMLNLILNSEGPIKIQSLYEGDINIDGEINIVDVLSVVNLILD